MIDFIDQKSLANKMKYIALVLVIAALAWAQNDTGISTANGVMSAYGTGKQTIQGMCAQWVV